MGGASDSKKQLGKILLAQKLVSPDALQEMLEEQRREPGARLASTAARSGRITVQAALAVLAEQHGVPAIDLTRQVIVLGTLRLIPVEIARERLVLPIRLDAEQLLIAMSSPEDSELIEELAFVTGKAIVAHVTLDYVMKTVIEHTYAALQRGDEYYVGAHVTTAQLVTLGLPDLPRAPEPLAEPLTEPPPLALQSLRPPEEETIDEAFSSRVSPSQAPEPARVEHNTRVLLAHQGGELRTLLARALSDKGITVVEVDDGVQALQSAEASLPRVMVLESTLGGLAGLEVLRRLRASAGGAALSIVVVDDGFGGWRMAEDLRETFGVQHVFAPPVDMVRLVRCVRLLIDGQEVSSDPPPLSPEAEAQWGASMQAFERGDMDGAIAALQAGLRIDSEAFELHYHLGLLYGRRAELFAATQSLERAAKEQPRHFATAKNLAVMYQNLGLRRKAMDAWERAMNVAPDAETRAGIAQRITGLM